MKKFIFSVFALLGMTMSVSAQTLTVDPIDAVPGETVQATLKFTCDADKYAGLMFSMQFPTEIASKVSVKGLEGLTQPTVGKMDEETGIVKFSGINGLDSENHVIYLAPSTELKVNLVLADDIQFGSFDVKVTDIKLDENGNLNNVADVTFKLNILELETVTLDEESSTAPVAKEGVNVIVKRTIKENEWSTICLPFAMTGDQLKKAFGDDVMLAKFSEWSFEGSFPSVETMKIVFANLDINNGLEANYPCMIKVSKAISEFKVSNVNITPNEYLMSADVVYKVQISQAPPRYNNYTANMYATYTKMDLFPGAMFVSGNKFWYVNEKAPTMKGFRGYFYFVDKDYNSVVFPDGASSRITMEFGDGTTDAIEGVETVEENDVYYNLRGQRVDTPAKGIYIKNGKKVVVK